MQVNPQEVSAEKATTPRYDTIVSGMNNEGARAVLMLEVPHA